MVKSDAVEMWIGSSMLLLVDVSLSETSLPIFQSEFRVGTAQTKNDATMGLSENLRSTTCSPLLILSAATDHSFYISESLPILHDSLQSPIADIFYGDAIILLSVEYAFNLRTTAWLWGALPLC